MCCENSTRAKFMESYHRARKFFFYNFRGREEKYCNTFVM
jgi:hypothetical protein